MGGSVTGIAHALAGGIEHGDEIRLVHRDENRVSISDALGIYLHDSDSSELLQRALSVEYLSASWREEFGQLI